MKTAIWLMALLLLLPAPVCAAEEALWDSVDTGAVEDQAEGYLDAELEPGFDFDAALAELGRKGLVALDEIVTSATRSGALILVIALFTALLQSLSDGVSPQMKGIAGMVGALAVTGAAVGDVHSLLQEGQETILRLGEFTKALLPALTTASAAAGAVTSAAARQMATLVCSHLLISLMTGVLLPLVYLYIAACVGGEVTGNSGIRAIGQFIHWAVKSLLTWILLAFTAYISLSGVISGSADRAALKLTRFAVSGMVPVVGGILSDASESVLVGAGLLRNTIGIYGTIAVLAFCLLPFLRLGIRYLLYKLASVLTAVMTQSSLARLVGEMGTAFGLVLAMTAASAMVTLISVIAAVSVVTG